MYSSISMVKNYYLTITIEEIKKMGELLALLLGVAIGLNVSWLWLARPEWHVELAEKVKSLLNKKAN